MAINIVMGPSCAGKSHFIKETFPNYTVIDLFDFQKDFMSVEEVMQSYIDCKNALIKAIKEDKNVVLEHTLLKAKRRPMYIDAIKEVTNMPINIYVVLPEKEDHLEFAKMRNAGMDENSINMMLELLEIPTKEEGFENIYIITPKYNKKDN